ncbi:hypothetical protein IWW50_001109, partial [Coemansia erecta]
SQPYAGEPQSFANQPRGPLAGWVDTTPYNGAADNYDHSRAHLENPIAHADSYPMSDLGNYRPESPAHMDLHPDRNAGYPGYSGYRQ